MASKRMQLAAIIAALVVGLSFSSVGGPATATHSPANKVAVGASTIEELETQLVEGKTSRAVTLLTASVKTSAPADLIFQLTAECALVTDTVNVGDSTSEAVATVKMWIEVDNRPVSVSKIAGDDGQIVFCNRAVKAVLTGFAEDEEQEDETEKLELYHSSRSANAFNWVKLNLGNGPHTIAVRGILEAEVTGTGKAVALIGRRSLVVEPGKFANDATF